MSYWLCNLLSLAYVLQHSVLISSFYLRCAQQIYCHHPAMASGDSEYTSVDFLSKIRLQPKRNIFKHLSLDTDLEEINQVLSPKAQLPPAPPTTLDRDLTRRFVLQLITKYENESEANAKWEGFLKSMDDAQSFEVFVQSLKEIKDERKIEPAVNPENETAKEGNGERNRKIGRSISCKKLTAKEGEKKEGKAVGGLREKIREQVGSLKDLLLAGEKFLKEIVSDYS